ncbi:hypothetical protein M9H77_18170 [Catharanthus roseus]|uniref:Uncharacterized protein n=1 Tax=Catharanthus roseus TaxID=4058 RepID=A0ACC0B6W6_CATRO|nr:hypothetical protein M9H77_18170 [Catharanthus roseus]
MEYWRLMASYASCLCLAVIYQSSWHSVCGQAPVGGPEILQLFLDISQVNFLPRSLFYLSPSLPLPSCPSLLFEIAGSLPLIGLIAGQLTITDSQMNKIKTEKAEGLIYYNRLLFLEYLPEHDRRKIVMNRKQLVVNNRTRSYNLYLETLQVSVRAAASGAERAWRVRLLSICTVPRRLTGTDQRRKTPEGSHRNRTDRLFERRERGKTEG